MGHELKLITFYVEKHLAVLEICHTQPLVPDLSTKGHGNLGNFVRNDASR